MLLFVHPSNVLSVLWLWFPLIATDFVRLLKARLSRIRAANDACWRRMLHLALVLAEMHPLTMSDYVTQERVYISSWGTHRVYNCLLHLHTNAQIIQNVYLSTVSIYLSILSYLILFYLVLSCVILSNLIYLSICLSVYLSICLSVYLSINLSIYQSIKSI